MLFTEPMLEGYQKKTHHLLLAATDVLRKHTEILGIPMIHMTRVYEYPWALEVVPPRGRIFDVGTDDLFMVMMLAVGVDQLTVHKTEQDVHGLAKIQFGPTHYPIYSLYRDYAKQVQMVVGHPHRLPLAPNTYDVIYNISVMEHVPKHLAPLWMNALWETLKPGGAMVMTCDYSIQGEGEGFWNHDYSQFIADQHAIVEHGEGVPWREGKEKIEADGVMRFVAEAADDHRRILGSVYGVVLRKPMGNGSL